MRRLLIGAVIAALGITAQAGEPDGAHDGAEWQIWAYSSAAPAPLGTNATVLGLDGSVLALHGVIMRAVLVGSFGPRLKCAIVEIWISQNLWLQI